MVAICVDLDMNYYTMIFHNITEEEIEKEYGLFIKAYTSEEYNNSWFDWLRTKRIEYVTVNSSILSYDYNNDRTTWIG